MEVLQSSAISSKGGACLCICWNEKRPWKVIPKTVEEEVMDNCMSGLGIPQLGLITSLSRADQAEQNMQLTKSCNYIKSDF